MIRLAAVGDLHAGADSSGILRPHFDDLDERADVLLIAGDLTKHGDPAEAAVLAAELRGCALPKVCVLGNHDYHCDRQDAIAEVMEEAGIDVLDGDSVTVNVNGASLGIAGTKGFCGGFAGACGTEFGEPEMKAFIAHTRTVTDRFEAALACLDTEVRVALLHYAPVPETLEGERLELYPFLGSYLLGEAVDRRGADLVLHGHAHGGSEEGTTPGGVAVRNVAQPVINHAYKIYRLG